MFMLDLLHEFELGVWKAFFIHMVRLLYAIGQNTIQELNFWCVCCDLPESLPIYLRIGTVESQHLGGIQYGDSVITYQQ